MPGRATPISPELQRRVQRAARWIWSAVIVMAGVIVGALAARSYDARRDHALRQSPAGPQYGQIMSRLELDQPTLREALKVLAEKSGARIDVDWPALKELGVDCDKPLKLQWDLRDISLDQVLNKLLLYTPMAIPDTSNHSIDVVSELGALRITTSEAELARTQNQILPTVVRIYDVEAVLRKVHNDRAVYGEDGDDNVFSPINFVPAPVISDQDYLVRQITDIVAPVTWMDAGGTVGAIKCVGDKVIVAQVPENQISVKKTLEELLDDNPTPAAARPKQYDEIELDRVVPELKLGHVTLFHAVQALRQKTGANIVVNWQRLSEAGIMPNVGVQLSLDRATLEDVLTALVARVESHKAVTAWGIRDRIITISTAVDLGPGSPIMRSYPVADLLPRMTTQPASAVDAPVDPGSILIDRLVQKVSPDDWNERDGDEADPRRHYTANVWAGRLLVVQTLGNQRKIARYLESLREGK